MRVDYQKAFPAGMRTMAELGRALRSDVLRLDGLDLPGNADAAGSA